MAYTQMERTEAFPNITHSVKLCLAAAGIGGASLIGWKAYKWWRKCDDDEVATASEPTVENDPRIKRIGITGAAGLIGGILREKLPQHDDFELVLFTMFDDEVDGSIGVDLSEADKLKGKFDDLDCVIHLAADCSSLASWESVIKNNVAATYNVFRECADAGVKKVIFASSNHIMNGHVVDNFDNPESINLEKARSSMFTEFDDPLPDGAYGVSKLTGEAFGKLFAARYGIDVVCFRIGWITSEDNPNALHGNRGEFLRCLYLSQRDCVQAFLKAIKTKLSERSVVLNLTSANSTGIYNLDRARQLIGYIPLDGSK
ncbi:uncharacterized protein YtbQ-like [Ptychodera flava]|uniref:uncharacterized protein YtbQ-like n=1 Tax=Ptychodera flava TaxID=63121 RepID=UPI00396A8154